jgi:hypothetical protein
VAGGIAEVNSTQGFLRQTAQVERKNCEKFKNKKKGANPLQRKR